MFNRCKCLIFKALKVLVENFIWNSHSLAVGCGCSNEQRSLKIRGRHWLVWYNVPTISHLFHFTTGVVMTDRPRKLPKNQQIVRHIQAGESRFFVTSGRLLAHTLKSRNGKVFLPQEHWVWVAAGETPAEGFIELAFVDSKQEAFAIAEQLRLTAMIALSAAEQEQDEELVYRIAEREYRSQMHPDE